MEPLIDRQPLSESALDAHRSADAEGKCPYSVAFRSSVNHEGSTDSLPGAAARTIAGNSFWHRTHQRRAMCEGA